MIYKYYSNESKYALDNFRNDTLCFSHVAQFNDMHEFDMQLENDYSYMGSLVVENRRAFGRVCCFCKASDLDNMWANYANNGHGFCLGYDEKAFEEADRKIRLIDVQYCDEIPTLSENTDRAEHFINQVSHKNKCWSNEREMRAIIWAIKDSIRCDLLKEKMPTGMKSILNIDNIEYIPYVDYINKMAYWIPKNILVHQVRPNKLIVGARCYNEYECILRSVADDKNILVEKRS